MKTLHLVSHTHWDREWYLTFQQFRLKLVHLVDGLLDLLDHDRDFKYFMLDGQTIVLDDYLLMRPEREADLRRYIKNGRLLIGPWHILPDEFLVSPEATIRNLLQGDRTAKKFGPKMMVGYIPDPFGHIGQMPQILRGFGIDSACLWRGLSDEPCEFWWQAPDGSRVFMAYLRDGYGNAALLPASEQERFTALVREVRDNLAPHSASDHLLLMYGTDHMEPPPETSRAIKAAQGKLDGDKLIQSTLPAYLRAAQSLVNSNQLPVVKGELRDSKRSHLLPGVLSTRMWIKQRNRADETLLEKWVEPFSIFAELSDANRQSPIVNRKLTIVNRQSSIIRYTWRLLMENHPHDSICGCSIDQVHDEMKVRFDQVEQIGEEITKQSLEALAASINTTPATRHSSPAAIVVFNPTAGPRTDLVTARAEFQGEFEIVDEQGNVIPCQVLGSSSQDLVNAVMGKKELRSGLAMIHEGRILGKVIREAVIQRDGSQANIEVVLADAGKLDLAAWESGLRELEVLLADPTVTTYHARAHSIPAAEIIFTAKEVPGHGYRTFWLHPVPASPTQPMKVGLLARFLMPLVSHLARLPFLERLLTRQKAARPPYIIENEHLHIEASPADGTLTVKDKQTGAVYRGLNSFVDGGDCGDEYNYSPPASDFIITARLMSAHIRRGPVQQTLELSLELKTPAELALERKSRARYSVPLPITTRVTLTKGVPRVDIQTEVDNCAKDHRLRVHFPMPESGDSSRRKSRRQETAESIVADYDGHFEVIRRPIGVPEFDETWIEQPRPEKPQRAFTDVSDGQIGLMIANRGLPEVEVIRNPFSSRKRVPESQAEIALTLLRCINWISRDDFEARKGNAGPMASTPGAQMIGRWTFDYSIIPHAVGRDGIPPYEQAYAFEAPMRAVNTGLHDGHLPAVGSFVSVEPREFVISAIKEAEACAEGRGDGHGWLVRGYNIADEEIKVTLKPWRKFKRVERVNLAEQPVRADSRPPLRVARDGSVTFAARGHEIVTVKFGSL
jgi:alpha-mannosidase